MLFTRETDSDFSQAYCELITVNYLKNRGERKGANFLGLQYVLHLQDVSTYMISFAHHTT